MVRISTEEGVRILTLERPDKLNAFNAAMHADLRAALDQAAGEEAVKLVVLTGAGRAFSSGQDLTEDLPRDGAGRVDLGPPLARDYNPLVLSLLRYPKPTIAAVNGPAAGAAMNIALSCDIVLAARSATLQEAFVRIALVPDAGGTWLLPRIVGTKRALALMLTGEPVGAEEAERIGLVHKVFDDATFAAEVGAFAKTMAKGPALAYRLIKQAMAASGVNDLEAQLVVEARLQREAGVSADFAEGVAAFREKRPPRFSGR
jgi:2-(1,2-epoxy-1,2-dihydrophenyl)acetyl-CoA isomerase